MTCYPYARDRFKTGLPNGLRKAGGGDEFIVVPVRTDFTRVMRKQTSMATLPSKSGSKNPNRAKRHRLNPGRRPRGVL